MNYKQPSAYPLRMPAEVKEALEERARRSGRTLKAEILRALEQGMQQEDIRMWTADELIAELIRRHGVKIQVVVEQPPGEDKS